MGRLETLADWERVAALVNPVVHSATVRTTGPDRILVTAYLERGVWEWLIGRRQVMRDLHRILDPMRPASLAVQYEARLLPRRGLP